MRGIFLMSMTLGLLVWCAACKKAESTSPGNDAPRDAAASASPAPANQSISMPPAWLQPALSASFFDDQRFDEALQTILRVPDHADQITAFARSADEAMCMNLMFVVAALAGETQDPKYLGVASAISARLREVGAADAISMLVPMAYPPEIVGPQMLSALNDDSVTALDHCGVVNWLSEWHGRDPGSVAAIVDSSEARLRTLFDSAMRDMDRDHGALGLVIARTLRECGLISRDESLWMLDQWQTQYGHIAGFRTMYDRIRSVCDQPDQ